MTTAKDLFKFEHSHKILAELPQDESVEAWKWMAAIAEHPRCSYKTEKFRNWVMEMGKKLGAECKQDEAGNICMTIPGSAGKENVPGIVLQGHTDMVGTKTSQSKHNFDTDPILMRIDGDWLKATDTTLGSDNGIGLAIALAFMEDKSLTHGPMCLLFTNDEEVGLEGAANLKPGFIPEQFKYLLNIDSEEWGSICVSCAGAAQRRVEIPYKTKTLDKGMVKISYTLEDMVGGHTGVQIHEGRGSSIMWLVKILLDNNKSVVGAPFHILKFKGGHAHNAIPSSAMAEVVVAADIAEEYIKESKAIFDVLSKKFSQVENNPPVLKIEQSVIGEGVEALDVAASRNMLLVLPQLYHGVWAWSNDVDNLVETSQSLSIAELKGNTLDLEIFLRSSIDAKAEQVARVIEELAKLHGGKCSVTGTDMAGWPAQPNSDMLTQCKETYKNLFGVVPPTYAIHAGLECGVILGIKPDMEALSVGPDLKNPHTPEECLDIPTTIKLFKLCKGLVIDLAK